MSIFSRIMLAQLIESGNLTKKEKIRRNKLVKNKDIKVFLEAFSDNILAYSPTGCWLWTGAPERVRDTLTGQSRTYGKCSFTGGGFKGSTRVHTLVWEIVHGRIIQPSVTPSDPGRLDVDHICETPLCCNPDHLQLILKTLNGSLALSRPAARDELAKTDPEEVAKWVEHQDTKTKMVFEAWKKQGRIPDFWFYLKEYKGFFREWLEIIKLHANAEKAAMAIRKLAMEQGLYEEQTADKNQLVAINKKRRAEGLPSVKSLQDLPENEKAPNPIEEDEFYDEDDPEFLDAG